MIGSRLTAVGLVAAAALWIASGHFIPHESAEEPVPNSGISKGSCFLNQCAV